MTVFEFVFAVFGILFGLAVAEVMGGFGKAFKSREKIKVGWLTPTLGLLVLIELTGACAATWTTRHALHFSVLALLVIMAITSLYYLAATLVFPGAPEEWPDLDAYFDRHRRWVVGALVLGNLALIAAQAVLGVDPLPGRVMKLVQAAWLAMCAGLCVIRNRRANLALLLGLVALDLGVNLANAATDPFRDNGGSAG